MAQNFSRMERGENRKGTSSQRMRKLGGALDSLAGGLAGTLRTGTLRAWLASAGCFALLACAPMPDGSRPFAVAAFAAQLSPWWGAPSAFVGCVLGILLRWDASAWANWWQAPACAALWLSFPLWKGKDPRQRPLRAGIAAGLMLLLPVPLLPGASFIARVQCVLGAAVAVTVAPVFYQLCTVLRERPRPLRSDERLCALLGLGALALGGTPFALGECNLGAALAAGATLMLAMGCGASGGLLGGVALGSALVVGGVQPWMIVALGAGGALAGGMGGRRLGMSALFFLLGAVAGAALLRGGTLGWGALSPLALGVGLCFALPAGLTSVFYQYAAPANEEGAVRPEAVSAAFAHALESRARSLSTLPDALPQAEALSMEMPERLSRLAALHCAECDRRRHCWQKKREETAQVLGSLIEIGEERDIDAEDVTHTVALIGCTRAARLPGALGEMLREEARQLALEARQAEARALAGVQFEGLAQCMQGVARALREETAFLPALQRRVQRALTQAGIIGEVLTVTQVGGRVEVLLSGPDTEQLREAGRLVSKAAGMPMRLRLDEAMEETEVLFEQEASLEVDVGIAKRTKHGETEAGDGCLVRRLSGGRQLLALSDGMGSGARAKQESQATLLLLQQCLNAGYTRAQALVAVNGLLLSCAGQDMFATMDLCLLDLHNGEAAFEKLGACTSYVVRGDACRPIAGETLPLGILSNIRPRSYRMRLQEGDLVVLLSDGVADTYPGGEEGIARALIKHHALPAQSIADSLLQRALANQGDCPRDDMTALCARLLLQNEQSAPILGTGERGRNVV